MRSEGTRLGTWNADSLQQAYNQDIASRLNKGQYWVLIVLVLVEQAGGKSCSAAGLTGTNFELAICTMLVAQ